MKHTDFETAYTAIEELAKSELIAAIKAHGGEFIAPDYRKEGIDDLIIIGAFEDCDPEDILFTRAEITAYGNLRIYGLPLEPAFDEEPIERYEIGQIYKILDLISETTLVSDTRNEKRNKAAMQQVRAALGKSI